MAGFLTWLPDVLRSAGVDVYVMPGAETRTPGRWSAVSNVQALEGSWRRI